MYLECVVEIPILSGKISRFRKENVTYVRYVDGRKYHLDKKYNVSNHRIIGNNLETDPKKMIPNENFRKYLGNIELPEIRANALRSNCLREGTFL